MKIIYQNGVYRVCKDIYEKLYKGYNAKPTLKLKKIDPEAHFFTSTYLLNETTNKIATCSNGMPGYDAIKAGFTHYILLEDLLNLEKEE